MLLLTSPTTTVPPPLLLLLSLLLVHQIEAGADTDEQRLVRQLMAGYDTASRPVLNASHSVQVKFQYTIVQIPDVDEVNQVLTTNVWLEQEWIDERLFWNPNDYNGLEIIRLPCKLLWLPDIVLYNNADDFTGGYMQSKAMVDYNGSVFWPPPAKLRSTCKIDITYFPFDDQRCQMKFGSWTYDGYQVNISKRHDSVDTSNYIESGEWDLLRVELIRNEVRYPCCDEPYPDVTFHVVIRRRILYYVFNIVCPCLWLTILSLLGFWLPPDSGEKITLGITVLLSFSVFMLLIAEQMPATSEYVPLIGVYLTVTMATTSLSIALTVCVLHIYHVGPNKNRVPPLVKHFFFNYVARVLFIKTDSFIGDKSERVRRTSHIANNSRRMDAAGSLELGVEATLNNFLRQCQPLLRHYKFHPPDDVCDCCNGGVTRASSDMENRGCCNEATLGNCGEPAADGAILLDNQEDCGREKRHHKNCVMQNRSSQPKRGRDETKHYEQIAQHLRSLIKKQEEEETYQLDINDWRMLAYILDRFLFWLFFIMCTLSTFIILCIMPAYKIDYGTSSISSV